MSPSTSTDRETPPERNAGVAIWKKKKRPLPADWFQTPLEMTDEMTLAHRLYRFPHGHIHTSSIFPRSRKPGKRFCSPPSRTSSPLTCMHSTQYLTEERRKWKGRQISRYRRIGGGGTRGWWWRWPRRWGGINKGIFKWGVWCYLEGNE